MRLYLVRHGETNWNLESRFQGWADQPLSALGESQARELASAISRYHIDAAYCSDLQRAFQTAEILLGDRAVVPVRLKELREMDIGELDGLTEPEVQARFARVIKAWRTDPTDVQMPGGESLSQVQERAWPAVEGILEKHRGEKVLLVGHHSVNKTLLCRLLGIPLRHSRTLRQPPCALSVIDFLPDRHYVHAVNLNWRERTNVWIDLGEEAKERVQKALGIIFDLDGVLLDSMKHYATAWRVALAEWGVVPPEIEFYRRESEDAGQSIRHFFSSADKEIDQETMTKVVERMCDHYRSFEDIQPYPRAFEVVGKLKSGGRRLALVTGSRRRDIERLLSAEQLAFFDAVVCGDDVQNSKPDPEPFTRAVDLLGLSSESVIAIDNAPFGLRAAKAAGLMTIALTTTLPPEELHDADLILDSLDRLPGWMGLL